MSGRSRRTAFTLAELMVAVAVLIVIIVATAKIFGIAGRVAGLGEATADVTQEAATIERQLREDFRRIDDGGFLLIRCVRVRNDINLGSGGPLLDSNLDPDAFLRADQLFFFVSGAQHMATLGTRGTNIRGLGVTSRVYWGPGIQLAFKQASGDTANIALAHDFEIDPNAGVDPITPWYRGTYDTVWTRYRHTGVDPDSSQADYTVQSGGTLDATQPTAPNWVLARHAVVLADDNDDRPERFMYGNRTAFRIDQAPVFQGRVDGVAQQLQDIQRVVTVNYGNCTCQGSTPYARPWFDPNCTYGDQRDVIAALCGRGFLDPQTQWVEPRDLPIYTRTERIAPGMTRVDQALTNHLISGACGSFRVDWTYAPGTGEVKDPDGEFVIAPGADLVVGTGNDDLLLKGVTYNADPDPTVPAYREQPWFGIDDPDQGVYPYGLDENGDLEPDLYPWWGWAGTIAPDNIEQVVYPPTGDVGPDVPLVVYEAIFGFNQGMALNDDDNPDPVIYDSNDPDCTRVGYTPWPAAIRVTMTLYDREQRFGEGREVQFVVDLPRRD